MRYLLTALVFLFSASGHSHELPYPGPAREAHALYHKLRPLPVAEMLRYTLPISDKKELGLYFFDPAQSVLYECILTPGNNSEDSALCFDPRERKTPYAWSGIELDEAKKRAMTPMHRKVTETVVLSTSPPFAQRTTYVLYVGAGSVVTCRRTWTQYSFEHEMNGQTVYFKSEKKDDFDYVCERRYPR